MYLTSLPITRGGPGVAAKTNLPVCVRMVSEKEAAGIRRFVCGQLRDEADLRYSGSIKDVFVLTINDTGLTFLVSIRLLKLKSMRFG